MTSLGTRLRHLLVTGGAGFIGSNFIRHALGAEPHLHVTNLDLLTYSGNLDNLGDVASSHGTGEGRRYCFVQGDIGDAALVGGLLDSRHTERGAPAVDAVVNFAAESHVDRSILAPLAFVNTNVTGTASLLECCRSALRARTGQFRFLQVSTDEVYGSLGPTDPAFREDTPLAPNSPYAASKASADLLVRAYVETFDFPAMVTRCSNNYGPRQFPEKLIPLMAVRAMRDLSLPVYGDGMNVRDWIHVDDHCSALWSVLHDGELGRIYNIGGESEIANLDLVRRILEALNKPDSLIERVTDRPGHDRRYAMDISRVRAELGWSPSVPLQGGLESTIRWYADNQAWWARLLPESQKIAMRIPGA